MFEVGLVYLRPHLISQQDLNSPCLLHVQVASLKFAIHDNDIVILKNEKIKQKRDRGKEEMSERMRKTGGKGERGRNGKKAGKEGRG